MLVRFIAHAGISIEEEDFSILIDPWFFDSTPEYPVIESIGGGFKTIDFQIPRTTEKIEGYAPDAILVSHFHPHHSPVRDIRLLCQNSLAQGKQINLFHPLPSGAIEKNLQERVGPGVTRHGMEPGETCTIGPCTIEAKEHTMPFHRAWYVTSKTGSVLHIGDGTINKDSTSRLTDPVWEQLRGLAPSVLFLSSGGHNLRLTDKDGKRRIREAGICTPVEAARVAQVVQPRVVAAFGFYNHSIFKNRIEHILPAPQTEEEFQWAVSWLAPETRNVRLTPGYTFGIGDTNLRATCDTYLVS
ncbi:MAG: MBL fold metallo-hydrolase [bacterium]|nr:MBL fold metallo-hydrolase [bacterium]